MKKFITKRRPLAIDYRCGPVILLLCVLPLLFGCAHQSGPRFRTGTGDAGKFIVSRAVAHGAQTIGTNSLPQVRGSWRYAEDKSGVVIRMASEDYPAIEALLGAAFGAPHFGPRDTAAGGKVAAYRITRKGAMLQFGQNADSTVVIVLYEPTAEQQAAEFLRSLR